jgi:hypothetical protein
MYIVICTTILQSLKLKFNLCIGETKMKSCIMG